MRGRIRGLAAATLALLAAPAGSVRAQMEMRHPMEMTGPLGIPETRFGSGTSWLPDAAPMHAAHLMLGSWAIMIHGKAFLQYDRQGGPRGSAQWSVPNWFMGAATRPLASGQLSLRGMFSADPWTVGGRGYPLLLQSGESFGGVPLHDRQHPHDLFMELAALYDRPITDRVGWSVYLAPVGEPAVGPVAFPHRPSAGDDPLAPISHHWQDGTHVTFGVVTAGVFTHGAKLEASWFNGREPDENRTDFDYAGRRLDSFSGRVTVNPGRRWSLSAWYAYLRSPEGLHPDESLRRFGVAALTTQGVGGGTWSSALIYGANRRIGATGLAPGVTLESDLDIGRDAWYGRAEYVRKSAEELAVGSWSPRVAYDVGALVLGYARTLATPGGLTVRLGARGSMNFVPPALAPAYGGRMPLGADVYLEFRPGPSSGR